MLPTGSRTSQNKEVHTMRKGVLKVNVKQNDRTSLKEAGIFDVDLPDGSWIVVTGGHQFPHHDRALCDGQAEGEGILYRVIKDLQPRLILGLGQMIHDDAFRVFAPHKGLKRLGVHKHALTPEVQAVLDEYEAFDERVMALMRMGGQYLTKYAEVGNSHLIYIPSLNHPRSNEWDLLDFIAHTKERIEEWMLRDLGKKKGDDEGAEMIAELPTLDLPCRPEDFPELLGVEGDKRITVMGFGSAVRINGHTLGMVGDFRRRNPVTAAFEECKKRNMSILRGYDSKLSDGWLTLAEHSLPYTRRSLQYHEIPGLWDDELVGEMGDYDHRAKGFFVGKIVRGQIHGCNFEVQRGTDGRRCMVVHGKGYTEAAPAGFGKQGIITLPPRRARKRAKRA
jgi:hypothetical protein